MRKDCSRWLFKKTIFRNVPFVKARRGFRVRWIRCECVWRVCWFCTGAACPCLAWLLCTDLSKESHLLVLSKPIGIWAPRNNCEFLYRIKYYMELIVVLYVSSTVNFDLKFSKAHQRFPLEIFEPKNDFISCAWCQKVGSLLPF